MDREFYIMENIRFDLPENISVENNKKGIVENLSIKDNINNFTYDGKVLEVTVDATHCGYFNRNGYFYKEDGMAASCSSFLEPYPTPILTEHKGDSEPVGRTASAAFLPIPMGSFKMNTEDAKLRGRPTGKIRLKGYVTDEEAIKKVLTRRYLTVSIGGNPTGKRPYCSVCKESAVMSFVGPELTCVHKINTVDEETGKWIGLVVEGMNYAEWSFVNTPSDTTSDHVAGVVSMSLVGASSLDELGITSSYEDIDIDGNYIKDSLKSIRCSSCEYEGNIDLFDDSKCPKCGSILKIKDDKEDVNMEIDGKLLQKAKDLNIQFEDDISEEELKSLIAEAEEKSNQGKGDPDPEEEEGSDPEGEEGDDSKEDDSNDNSEEEEEEEESFEDQLNKALELLEKTEGCDDDISVFWKDASEEEINEVKELDDLYVQFLSMSLEDMPPSGSKKREKMDKRTFCGPNRTFPVDNCDRGATALSMLNWPNVKKKYSDTTRAKIRACVIRKGKTLGCPYAKKDSKTEDNQQLLAQVKDLTSQISFLKDELSAEKESKIQSDKQIVRLNAQLKDMKIEKYLDLSILGSMPRVKDILNSENKEEFDEAYNKMKDELKDRSMESLGDSIKDISNELNIVGIKERISDSTFDPPKDSEGDPISEILSNKKYSDEESKKRVNDLLGVGVTEEENDKEDK